MQENDLRSIATRTDVLQKDFMKEVADLTFILKQTERLEK